MTKDFLVVFEAGPETFSAFAPDIAGCYAIGPTVEITRARFLDAVSAHLEWMASDRDPMPEPITTSHDFTRTEDDETGHYVVEWLPIFVPASTPHSLTAA